MADEKPVRRAVRKTTKKVVRKTAVRKRAINEAPSRRGVLTLKFIFITMMVMLSGAAGSLYLGYSAEGAIDVSQRLSDRTNYIGLEEGVGGNEPPIPEPPRRPNLQPAAQEEKPKPAPAPVDESATSTDATASSTEDVLEDSGENTENDSDTTDAATEESADTTEADAVEPSADETEVAPPAEEASPQAEAGAQ